MAKGNKFVSCVSGNDPSLRAVQIRQVELAIFSHYKSEIQRELQNLFGGNYRRSNFIELVDGLVTAVTGGSMLNLNEERVVNHLMNCLDVNIEKEKFLWNDLYLL